MTFLLGVAVVAPMDQTLSPVRSDMSLGPFHLRRCCTLHGSVAMTNGDIKPTITDGDVMVRSSSLDWYFREELQENPKFQTPWFPVKISLLPIE